MSSYHNAWPTQVVLVNVSLAETPIINARDRLPCLGVSFSCYNNNRVYETAKETLMYKTVFWTLLERARVG